jgi:hypothetical protein
MRERLSRLARGAALLVLVAGIAFPGVGYASKNDDDKKDKQEKSEQARSEREDHELAGQVMEINTLKDPPELYMANTDGIVTVKMLKTDEIARNGVRLGDHVSVIGEKVNELLFEAQELTVDAHLGDDQDD